MLLDAIDLAANPMYVQGQLSSPASPLAFSSPSTFPSASSSSSSSAAAAATAATTAQRYSAEASDTTDTAAAAIAATAAAAAAAAADVNFALAAVDAAVHEEQVQAIVRDLEASVSVWNEV